MQQIEDKRRDKFNQILRSLDLVLMNKIPEVDPSVYENWQSDNPSAPEDCEWFVNKATEPAWCCNTHMFDGTGDYPATEDHPEACDFAESDLAEIYQWYAVNESDADYLKRHNQYVTYSDLLDCHFLAITHFGTAWDYTDMVDDFLGKNTEGSKNHENN